MNDTRVVIAAAQSLLDSINRSLDSEYSVALLVRAMTGDAEADHKTADNILVEILARYGLTKTIDAYQSIQKRHA